METRFTTPDLWALDELNVDAMCAFVPEGDDPLEGAVGLVDWRLIGLVQSVRERARLGARGESLLVATARRFTTPRLWLIGTGAPETFDESATGEVLRCAFRLAVRADCQSLLLEPPRAPSLSDDKLFELLFDATREAPDLKELIIIAPASTHRAHRQRSLHFERRARAQAAPPDGMHDT